MSPTQTYQTLPASQLNHPLFNPDTAGHLKVPLFEPVSQFEWFQNPIHSLFLQSRVTRPESVGQALEISPPENDPLRIFGLPKNLLLEVGIFLTVQRPWPNLYTHSSAFWLNHIQSFAKSRRTLSTCSQKRIIGQV